MESCTHEELREDLSNVAVGGGNMRRGYLSRYQKGRDDRTTFERLHGKKSTHEFVPLGEKVLARPISSEPLNRMNPRYKLERTRSGGIDAKTCAKRSNQQRDVSDVESCRRPVATTASSALGGSVCNAIRSGKRA